MNDIERLLAIEEIKRLKARYFYGIDNKDWELWRREVWAPDARLIVGEMGRDIGPRDVLIDWVAAQSADQVSVHHGHYEASAGPILSPHSQDRCISDSLEGIISQECVSRVWQARPSTVTGCKSCLVRFACRNSRVFRKLGEDVWSPPVNCEILTEHALEA